MNLNALSEAAADNRWDLIGPEIALGVLALGLLVLEVLLPLRLRGVLPRISIWGQTAIFVWVATGFGQFAAAGETFSGLMVHSETGQLWRLFFLGVSILVSFLAGLSLDRHRAPRVEFHHLTLVITAALMLLAQSNHFVMLFVSLETATVGFYILVAYYRRSPLSLEAGLKYLIMGALSSGILLFGIVLLYGVGGNPALSGASDQSMHFGALQAFLALNPDHPVAVAGVVLVLAGIAFKIGAVPFQIWIPDVYQGAPTPVTAFLAVGSKAAGFAVLLNLVVGPFAPMDGILIPLLAILAGLSILFGNLAALTQRNVKRLMGLSGVSHAGFLLLGVVATTSVSWAGEAVFFYLCTYLLGSFAVFGVMTHLAGDDDAVQEIDHYIDLAKNRPLLGGVLAVGLGSLAGIPPLAGFVAKALVFIAIFQAGHYVLLGVAVIGVVLSIYYYFGWIRAAFFNLPAPAPIDEDTPPATRPWPAVTSFAAVTLVALALALVFLGFFQGPLGRWLIVG